MSVHLRLSLVGTVAAVSIVVLAGCSGSDSPPALPDGGGSGSVATSTSASPAPALPATTITFRPTGRQLGTDPVVLAAYQAFWVALGTAYTSGDVTALQQTTGNPVTTRFGTRARTLKAAGETQQGPIELVPTVATRSTRLVVVVDCADLRNFRTYERNGTAKFPKDAALTAIRAGLENQDGRWRVTQYSEQLGGCRRSGG